MHVVETAEWRFSDGWVSPAYGVRVVAQHVTCSVRGMGGANLTTLFCAPGQHLRARPAMTDGVPQIRVRWRDREGVLFFAGQNPNTGAKSRMQWVESDASQKNHG